MGLTAEDRLAIMETLSRYNQAIDGLQPDAANAWADTFTEDGTFQAVGEVQRDPEGTGTDRTAALEAVRTEDALISLSGQDELLAFAKSVVESSDRPAYHWVNNVVIDGDGNRATMTCYLRVMDGKTKDHPEVATVTGYYRDQLRKVGDAWKFESRFVTFDG